MSRRRRVSLADRTVLASVLGAVAWLAFGGQLGAAAGLLVFVLVQFPAVLHGLRPTGGRDMRSAAAALASAAAVVAVVGFEHLTTLIVVSAAAAAVAWAWPLLRRNAHRARPAAATARGRARIKGNHHGRVNEVEEVPTGRVGISRKKGGDGPTQIELCARADRANQLTKVAARRHVNARWQIASRPAPCPIAKEKRHWRLRAVGRARRTR